MSDKIVTMGGSSFPDQTEINEQVVELLRDMLAEARAGNVNSVALAYITHSGGARNCFTGGLETSKMAGSIAMLQHDFLNNWGS